MGDLAEQLMALGLASSESAAAYQKEQAAKEKQKDQKRQNEYRRQENNMGQNRNRGGKGGNNFGGNFGGNLPQGGNNSGRAVVPTAWTEGIYGEVLSATPTTRPQEIATAPYNFVPLPHAVLPSPLNESVGAILQDKKSLTVEENQRLRTEFRHYLREGEHYSGKIELEIESISPLFIGGAGENSFAPTGKYIIPGSEIKGMIKNLLKIVTLGGWQAREDMVDRHLYYRQLMATDKNPHDRELCDRYKNYMTSTVNGTVQKNAKPGFLVKRRGGYVIYPLLPDKVRSIPIKEYMQRFDLRDGDVKKSCVRWDDNTAYIQVGLLSTKKLLTKEAQKSTTKDDRKKWGKQYYKYYSLQDIDKAKSYPVPPELLEEYQSDKNRRGMDLVKKSPLCGKAPTALSGLEPFESIIPCFFFLEEGTQRVKSFGHGQSYRIPYDHSTMDAVPAALKQGTVDFAAAMFGQSRPTVSWASRLTFGDAMPTENPSPIGAAERRALMQPNPTSFQLYLEQTDDKKLLHWDSAKASIRGYKLYWHQGKNPRWQASISEIQNLKTERESGTVDLLKKINPLAAGSKFSGQITFRDLTKEELGALLRVLNLASDAEDIVYKIGQGKSIGLGSIRMQSRLYLEDGSRFTTLFDDNGWHDSLQEATPTEFIAAYENYVRAQGNSFWQDYQEALANMRSILDWKNTARPGWQKATAAMDGNTKNGHNQDKRFALRAVLPALQKVVSLAGKRIEYK
ncbi:MAG: TIGR03986 family CRISPR-associated RAMP protein [Selenomonadaceae bacterium]|nr:TIGR03986 family CRISPR-associated RAMP protein [Selenomonadaceae bacterium]